MTLDSLRLVRNILFRTVAISLCLSYTSIFVTFAYWDTWNGLVSQWFHITSLSREVMLNFFAAVKFYNLFVLLAPALALHWTIKSEMRKVRQPSS
jgi:hypothetical protein